MENNEDKEVKSLTANQEILIKKLLKSKKFKDIEYRELRNVLDHKVLTVSDGCVLIDYLLSTLAYRRTFFNGKHKAYKKCFYCSGRDHVKRYTSLSLGINRWICNTCYINLDGAEVVPVKMDESKEVEVKLLDHNRNQELTPAQEDSIHEHKEQ